MIVVTLHGVGPHGCGYAASLFDTLGGMTRMPAFRGIECRWRAWPRGLAWWALGFPRIMGRAQRGLDGVAALAMPQTPVLLVTHSAGCRIAYDWFTRRGHPSPIVAWVSAGANRKILEGVALPFGLKPVHLPPWTHVYRTGDPLGGPLAAFGARDVPLVRPTATVFRDHADYWSDPTFARAVAEALPR